MLYTVAGYISAFFFALCLVGIWIQLRAIWKRKGDVQPKGRLTSVLSLNHFVVRFIAFFAIFVLGFARLPFNPYLVFPYLPAVVLLLLIVREIYLDRRTPIARAAFLFCSVLLLLGICLWGFCPPQVLALAGTGAEFVLLSTAVLIAQSDAHQMYLIRRSGDTGVVALRTHQATLMKDLTAVLFAVAMGPSVGWPIIASAGTSAVTKSLILYHFRWVRRSSAAERVRRVAAVAAATAE